MRANNKPSPEIIRWILGTVGAVIVLHLLRVKSWFDAAVETISVSESSSGPAQCPVWAAYNVTEQGDKEFKRCDDLSSVIMAPESAAAFTLSHCMSDAHCGQGYFTIKRRDGKACDDMFARNISRDAATDAWMKKTIGPDAFYFSMDGGEKLAPSDWRHLGQCVYKLPYRTMTTGNFNVSIFHTHDRFMAVDEYFLTDRPIAGQFLLKNYTISVCPHCAPVTHESVTNTLASVPLCSRAARVQGTFLEGTPKGLEYRVANGGRPLGCRYDQMFEQGANATCHNKNRNIIIAGDSQSRNAWDAMDSRMLSETMRPTGKKVPFDLRYRRFNQSGMYATEVLTPFEDSSRPDMLSTRIGWFNNPFQEDFLVYHQSLNHQDESWTDFDDKFLRFDTFFFNGAHWHSSGPPNHGHYTLSRYKAWLNYIVENMGLFSARRGWPRNDKPMRFIWMGVASLPIRVHNTEFYDHHLMRKDWRSHYRFKLMSDAAEEIVGKHGIASFDSFSTTMPWLWESKDMRMTHGPTRCFTRPTFVVQIIKC
ncbi:hypothetical protein HK101_011688 [Irineochytrium annulatum]|nr:hypothetical protein HK101_011688 [Irineochytrium annulatum]